MGWRSIWSATPGVLDLLSISVYNWKLHLKQDHKVSKGAKNRPTRHGAWNLNLLMHSLPQSQSSRVNSVPDTSKKMFKKIFKYSQAALIKFWCPHPSIQSFPWHWSPWVIQSQLRGEWGAQPSLEKHFEYFRSAKYLVKE